MAVKKALLIFMFIFLPLAFSHAQTPVSVSEKKIKILIVPGHDNDIWGAQYGSRKEADMTLKLGTKIYDLLKKDNKFEVYITRDKNGYLKEFGDYFTSQREKILSFKEDSVAKMKSEISSGGFLVKKGVFHITAKEEMAIKLFGLNKWANENDIDFVLHIHFNDYPRKTKWTIGKYKGIAVYVPDPQMPNSLESRKIAQNIYSKLMTKYVSSTYPKESTGIIEDQNLIALGEYKTLNAPARSVLVEYGYIYGKIFRDPKTREKAYQNMADLTVKGIKKYFK